MELKYTFEQIEQFLDNDLSAEEMQEFEQELRINPGLAAELTRHEEARALVDAYARVQLKEKVKLIQDAQRPQIQTTFSVYRMAAALAVLVMAFGAYFYLYQTYSNPSLVADNFETYPNRFTTMGLEDSDPFTEALEHYDKREYQEALSKFRQVPSNSQNYLPAQLYLGIAFYALGELDEAISAFEKVEETPSVYQEVGRWYLALCYLKTDRNQQAQSLLQEIVEAEGYRWKRAQNILQRMQSPLRGLPGI